MSKATRTIDIVVERKPGLYFAQVLGDEDVSAIGVTRSGAVDAVRELAVRVLQHYPGHFAEREGALVVRHLRFSLPATRMGRMRQLELYILAVCEQVERGHRVELPQLGMRFEVKSLDELEVITSEHIRDRYGLEQRLVALLDCARPLTDEVDGDVVPRFELQRVAVRYKVEPASAETDELDEAPTLSAVGEPLHHRLR